MEYVERNLAPPLPSATVLLLRDQAAGLEVFLLKRHGLSDVLGGAYVFPGGKRDRDDLELTARLDQPLAALQASLGEPELAPDEAGALYIAAVREVFEETGVLFAQVASAGARRAWSALREGRRFEEVLDLVGTRLDTSGLVPWSRWITPIGGAVIRKRFDTRFFVAAVPHDQEPVHDEHEAIEGIWLSPRSALQRYWAQDMQFAPPQIMSLAHLSRFTSVAGVLADARSRPPPLVQPEPFEADGIRFVCYPGDERHPLPERAMPGPTRLCWRNGRFEPEGGLQALLS
ncbi:MAG TPA: NUDIX hydrolase [Ramlibacter sp.]|uniref:NUDIX hydrolase n=1 Tax=Ramlibacter sp. TaxID=1917967 RepID=UPI002C620D72|nr:NUDIX hydrolase [Ramlibacter sp.]HVZ46204.1 NUDIX hydrolase [Ramlibacter sp.]